MLKVEDGRLIREAEDICGFCGLGGADKIPAPLQYQDQMDPESDYVHQECEREEEERCAEIEWERRRREGELPPVGGAASGTRVTTSM